MRVSQAIRRCALMLLALAGQELIGRHRTRRQIAAALAAPDATAAPPPERVWCDVPNCAGHRVRA
jgi:hypothetical protein